MDRYKIGGDVKEAEGKKAILFVEEMYNDLEFWYPYYRLKEAGIGVSVVGPSSVKEYKGKSGTFAKADIAANEVKVEDYDGLIIPGGYAPDHMRRHPEMVRLVKDMFGAGKVVAAICHAGWMLASAEVLEGKTVTSFFGIRDDLVHAGANWVDDEVVVDGNLITSRMPDDLPAFMKAILQALEAGK